MRSWLAIGKRRTGVKPVEFFEAVERDQDLKGVAI